MNISLYAKWTLAHVREKGFFSAIGRIFEVAWQRIFQGESIIFCSELGRMGNTPLGYPAGIVFERKRSMEELTEEDLQRLSSVTSAEVAGRQLRERFERGADLWFARVAGQVAAYEWTIAGFPLVHFFFPMSDRDVHAFDIWTYKEHRNRGLGTYLDVYMQGELRKEGFDRVFRAIYRWNRASIRVEEKFGAFEYGRARKFRIFGRDLVIWSRMSNRRDVQPLHEGDSPSSRSHG